MDFLLFLYVFIGCARLGFDRHSANDCHICELQPSCIVFTLLGCLRDLPRHR